MRKVLLTYGYHKSGHYNAVRALEEELESRGITTETRNLWEGKAQTIDLLFTIFRAFAAKKIKKVPDFLIAPKLFELFATQVPFDINLHTYDGIISTHHYSSSLIAAHKEKQGCSVPLIHVHTDYTPFPILTEPKIDFYTGAIPREDVDTNLHQKLVATGIPVRKAFRYDNKSKEPKILILGGADGFGELEKIAEFTVQLDSAYKPQIMCGRNIAAYEKLKKLSLLPPVFGFIDDISPYLNRAEFVITKGSGLSVTEALNCECIPLFPPPILAWEDEAARYISAQGAGICIPEFDEIGIKAINAILHSTDYKSALRERGRRLVKPTAAKDIVDLLEKPPKNPTSEQIGIIEDMRRYRETFASANSLTELETYLTQEIDKWLNKYEPNNRS